MLYLCLILSFGFFFGLFPLTTLNKYGGVTLAPIFERGVRKMKRGPFLEKPAKANGISLKQGDAICR